MTDDKPPRLHHADPDRVAGVFETCPRCSYGGGDLGHQPLKDGGYAKHDVVCRACGELWQSRLDFAKTATFRMARRS